MKSYDRYVPVLYQAIMVLIAALILTISFLPHFFYFSTYDPNTAVQNWDTEQPPHEIVTGLYLQNFTDFNLVNNEFVADAILWFDYNPEEVSLDQIKQFSILDGHIINKSDPQVKQINERVFVQFDVRFSFKTQLNFRTFPLDDHFITLVVTNKFLPSSVALITKPKDFILDNTLHLPGWKVDNQFVASGYAQIPYAKDREIHTTKISRVLFGFSCSRTDPSIIIIVLGTMLLIIFFVLFSLSTDYNSIALSSASIAGLISFFLVVQSQSPSHVGYFMLSDFLFLICLLSIFLALLFGVASDQYYFSVRRKKFIIAGVYTLFAGGAALLSWIL